MRLYRSISSDLPLLVVALEEEATHLHGSELPVLVTGAGKVNAAVAGIPLTIVKQVSDQAGETASKSWASLVDECAQQLGIWVRDNVLK